MTNEQALELTEYYASTNRPILPDKKTEDDITQISQSLLNLHEEFKSYREKFNTGPLEFKFLQDENVKLQEEVDRLKSSLNSKLLILDQELMAQNIELKKELYQIKKICDDRGVNY